jgi:hypothetical protein
MGRADRIDADRAYDDAHLGWLTVFLTDKELAQLFRETMELHANADLCERFLQATRRDFDLYTGRRDEE